MVAGFMVLVAATQVSLELASLEITATRTQVSLRRKVLAWTRVRELPVQGIVQFQAVFERRSPFRYVGGITDVDVIYEDGRRAPLVRQLPRFGVTRRLAGALNAFYGFPEFLPKKSLISLGE